MAPGPGVLVSRSYADVVLLAAGNEDSVAVRESAERGESWARRARLSDAGGRRGASIKARYRVQIDGSC